MGQGCALVAGAVGAALHWAPPERFRVWGHPQNGGTQWEEFCPRGAQASV